MKMIKNYLNSLETYLPSDLKKDVREELESSIEERVNEQEAELGRELNDQEHEQILLSIGHPSRVAASYLPNQQLIGTDYFPAFKQSLQIALMIFLGLHFLLLIPSLFHDASLLRNSTRIFSELLDTAIFVFAIVTIIFYLMEKYQANLDELYAWSPKDIKEKNPKLAINRPETFFELVFQVIFIVWWNGLFNLPLTLSESSIFTTVSFSSHWAEVFVPVNVILGAGIVISLHKLLVAGWKKHTLIGNMLLNFASLFVLYQISGFSNYVVFDNPEIIGDSLARLTVIMDKTIHSIIVVFVLIIIWDIWSNIKWLRQN